MMNGNRIVCIKAYPRIHVTLIGMNESGLRINGGIGFSIKEPNIEITISRSKYFKINDGRQSSIDNKQLERLTKKINFIKENLCLNFNIEVSITGSLPVHSGFGSGTILRLASIEGLLILNDIPYNELKLVNMSGRGGTSGIGIRTYFNGGYVFDIGHKNVGQKLLPSSNRETDTIQSLRISEGKMPEWELGICYPFTHLLKTDTEEGFFIKNSAIKNETVYKTLYHVVYEVLAGIKEKDIKSFENGINALQVCDWKKSERDLYADAIPNAESILYSSGATMVGMSSLGPTLFFWGYDVPAIIEKSKQELSDWYFCHTTSNNEGRLLTVKNA